MIHEVPKNYSTAKKICKIEGGALIHILSEQRTHLTSELVRENKNLTRLHMAYIGLQEINSKGNFTTSSNESINCFRYRAWAPGHPRNLKHASCVAITRENSWKLVDCKQKLPFICEIFTSGATTVTQRNRKCPKKHPTPIKIS